MASSSYRSIDIQSKQQQQQTKFDDKRAMRLEYGRWLIVTISIMVVAIMFFVEYNDKEKNFTVHTDVESNTTIIDTPYFYFMVTSRYAYNFAVDAIYSQSYNQRHYIKYDYNEFNASHFSYDKDSDQWAVVHLPDSYLGLNTKQILIIPPQNTDGSKIKKGYTLRIMTSVYDNRTNPGDFPGLLWTVDSVQNGIIESDVDNITDAFIKRFGSAYLQHKFSPYDRLTMSSLTVISLRNAWDEKWMAKKPEGKITNSYYTANVNAVVELANVSYMPEDPHISDFDFYINPTGAGIQTTITTEKDKYFIDTLASIGGYFAPIASITSILLSISIFGLPVCCGYDKPLFKGFAPNKGLSNIQKQQFRNYLQELGVKMDDLQ